VLLAQGRAKQAAVAALQLYGLQLAVVAGWQVPAALQVRLETVLSPEQAAAAHWVPAATGLHTPTVPAMLQAWQAVPQAESQHTPLAQKLDAQSPGSVHGCPWPRLPQLPLGSHIAGGVQPVAGGVQLVAQTVALAHA
jgi:hypothetical protein